MPRIPYRLTTDRLVLRPWQPADAPQLKTVIDDNLDHLRRWMPWAHDEPSPVDVLAARLRRFRGRFDLDESWSYAITLRETGAVLGSSGIHTGLADGTRAIGYWITRDQTRRGYATEVAAALTWGAIVGHGVRRVEITCDPENVASAAIPPKLGFHRDGVLRHHELKPDGPPRDSEVWSLTAGEWPDSPAAAYAVDAVDVSGAVIPPRDVR